MSWMKIQECLRCRPEGKLEARAFLTLSEVVDPFIEERDGLNGIIIVTERFLGWEDFCGVVEHMRFVRNHHRQIHQSAGSV